MMNKIKNWLENHKYIYAGCLVFVSLCMVAFGFANLGGNAAEDEIVATVNPYSEEAEGEFTAE